MPIEAASRRLTLASFSQRWKRSLQRVRQALAAKLARANHLEQRAQHAAVVHDAVERPARNKAAIALRQNEQQRSRHVLHESALAAVDRQLGQEDVVVDLVHEAEQRGQLIFGLRVEGAIEAAGRGQLGQGVLGRQLVGAAPSSLRASARGRQALQTRKQTLVGHRGPPFKKRSDEVVVRVFPVRLLIPPQHLADAGGICTHTSFRTSDPMYSEAGSRTAKQITPDESLGRVLARINQAGRQDSNRWLPCTPRRQSGVYPKDRRSRGQRLRRSATELQRTLTDLRWWESNPRPPAYEACTPNRQSVLYHWPGDEDVVRHIALPLSYTPQIAGRG